MGCCCSHGGGGGGGGGTASAAANESSGGGGGGYSWDKRGAVDPKDYQVKGLKGEQAAKAPGTLNGQVFVIAECHDTDIYVFDHTASVTVDDCVNCTIFLGPIKGSVFIRDCTDCRVVVSCQQFRTRDCKRIEALLHTPTLPIIESTTDITFGCFRGTYFQLPAQFKAADLTPFTNYWHQIHDFTKGADGLNYALSTATPEWLEPFFARKPEAVASVQVDLDPAAATVPVTAGPAPGGADAGAALALAFGQKEAKAFLQATLRQAAEGGAAADFALATSTQVTLSPAEIGNLFSSPDNARFAELAAEFPAVGFVFAGSASAGVVAKAVAAAGGGKVYSSPNSATGAQEFSAWESIVATRTN